MNTAAAFAENVPPTENNDAANPNNKEETGETPLTTETMIIETIDHVDEEASTAFGYSLALACFAYIIL